MSSNSSPSESRLEYYRKQAKALLKAVRAADPNSLARLRVHLPHFLPDQPFLLSDAQWIIAREQGFASWSKFKQHLESLPAAAPAVSSSMLSAPTRKTDAQALQEIKTARWLQTHTHYDNQTGEAMHTFPIQGWIRLDPPAHAWRNDSDNSWSHDVIDERGHFHTASTWKICHFTPGSRPGVRDLLDHVFFLPPDIEQSREEALLHSRHAAGWQHETVEMDGQSLIRWQRNTVQSNFRVMETIWTEPDTHRIVRKERQETDLLTGHLVTFEVSDQYAYNIEIPEETFQMPPGKPIITPDYDNIMPEVWNALTSQQQQSIQKTIDRSDRAWRDADFSAFASVWKFDYVNYVPNQSQWQERVEEQAGLWRVWYSEIESANTQNFIPVRVSANASRWAGRRKVLWVRVKLHVAWGEESAWDGRAEFYLRRKFQHYRIVHWDCPWEEIKAARTGKSGGTNENTP